MKNIPILKQNCNNFLKDNGKLIQKAIGKKDKIQILKIEQAISRFVSERTKDAERLQFALMRLAVKKIRAERGGLSAC